MPPEACPHCGRQFGHRGKLNRHLLSHTGEKPFSCPMCDSRFRSNYALQRHINSHSGAKPYYCEDCEKGFSSKEHLMRHFKGRRHQPAKCDVCGCTFLRVSSLATHSCGQPCPSPLTSPSSLICQTCNRGFTSALKLHLHYQSKSHAKVVKADSSTEGDSNQEAA